MSDSFIFEARQGRINFLSDYNRARFAEHLKANEGRKYRIEPVVPTVSDNRRGWYWSAVLPFMKSLNVAWQDLDDDQVHEILKQEFNGFEATGIDGKVKKFGVSAVASNTSVKVFDNFILRLADWVNENYGMTLPDPENYKKNYRDVAEAKIDIPLKKIEYPEMTDKPTF
jgi:hypothetical protein